jgi:hypothetical protein
MAAPPPATAIEPLFRFQGQYMQDAFVRSA